jgi:dihydropteroate synthase
MKLPFNLFSTVRSVPNKKYAHVLSLLQSPDPVTMGVLNCTPNSFSDGGQFLSRTAALAQAHKMINSGADIIDIGGESSRPGAEPISPEEECERVIPLIQTLRAELDIPISIDTCKTVVMNEAIKAGASMINDIYALQDEGALDLVAKAGIPVCLMHTKGTPQNMQLNPFYHDVVQEVFDFLKTRIDTCLKVGIQTGQIVVDPGFGFGKNLDHNLTLLKSLAEFKKLNFPILVGLSRKHMIGVILNAEVENRLYGSLAAAVMACLSGATIIRTHDVGATKDALAIAKAVSATPYRTIQEETFA